MLIAIFITSLIITTLLASSLVLHLRAEKKIDATNEQLDKSFEIQVKDTTDIQQIHQSVGQLIDHASTTTDDILGRIKDQREAINSFIENALVVQTSMQATNKTISEDAAATTARIEQMYEVTNLINDVYVEQIRGVAAVVNNIADESDLLALRAALEGAKTKNKKLLELAADMRRLAKKTFTSATEIKELDSDNQEEKE